MRLVVHTGLARSLQRLQQESGRANRDGGWATSVVIASAATAARRPHRARLQLVHPGVGAGDAANRDTPSPPGIGGAGGTGSMGRGGGELSLALLRLGRPGIPQRGGGVFLTRGPGPGAVAGGKSRSRRRGMAERPPWRRRRGSWRRAAAPPPSAHRLAVPVSVTAVVAAAARHFRRRWRRPPGGSAWQPRRRTRLRDSRRGRLLFSPPHPRHRHTPTTTTPAVCGILPPVVACRSCGPLPSLLFVFSPCLTAGCCGPGRRGHQDASLS